MFSKNETVFVLHDISQHHKQSCSFPYDAVTLSKLPIKIVSFMLMCSNCKQTKRQINKNVKNVELQPKRTR